MKTLKETKMSDAKIYALITKVAVILYKKTGYDPFKDPSTLAKIAVTVKNLMTERQKNKVTTHLVMDALDIVRSEIVMEKLKEAGIDTSKVINLNLDSKNRVTLKM